MEPAEIRTFLNAWEAVREALSPLSLSRGSVEASPEVRVLSLASRRKVQWEWLAALSGYAATVSDHAVRDAGHDRA